MTEEYPAWACVSDHWRPAEGVMVPYPTIRFRGRPKIEGLGRFPGYIITVDIGPRSGFAVVGHRDERVLAAAATLAMAYGSTAEEMYPIARFARSQRNRN